MREERKKKEKKISSRHTKISHNYHKKNPDEINPITLRRSPTTKLVA